MTSSNEHLMKNNITIYRQRNENLSLSLLFSFSCFMRVLQTAVKTLYPHWTLKWLCAVVVGRGEVTVIKLMRNS